MTVYTGDTFIVMTTEWLYSFDTAEWRPLDAVGVTIPGDDEYETESEVDDG